MFSNFVKFLEGLLFRKDTKPVVTMQGPAGIGKVDWFEGPGPIEPQLPPGWLRGVALNEVVKAWLEANPDYQPEPFVDLDETFPYDEIRRVSDPIRVEDWYKDISNRVLTPEPKLSFWERILDKLGLLRVRYIKKDK